MLPATIAVSVSDGEPAWFIIGPHHSLRWSLAGFELIGRCQTTPSPARFPEGSPKSSILVGFFLINHPAIGVPMGTPIEGNPQMAKH